VLGANYQKGKEGEKEKAIVGRPKAGETVSPPEKKKKKRGGKGTRGCSERRCSGLNAFLPADWGKRGGERRGGGGKDTWVRRVAVCWPTRHYVSLSLGKGGKKGRIKRRPGSICTFPGKKRKGGGKGGRKGGGTTAWWWLLPGRGGRISPLWRAGTGKFGNPYEEGKRREGGGDGVLPLPP